ncbi:DUF1772 domain-containing protein [Paenibacillus sp. LMG 31460]|uniref:DUF1772 domain-containing protein n=1 Tax=Paenibacillus germinis TaxID=2654979 RepID=A0ABX1Z680_9BACL|nr:anthrone oxygenase family protein [Paenibacillus germinis]NOU88677.1 DUF1772 domain-containing protein [Paenibacillus germinis]
MNKLLYYLTFASALGSGLLSGVFFAFSAFVMTALARLSVDQGISVMQAINTTILKSLFILIFFGATLLAIILGIASVIKLSTAGAAYVFIGSLLIIVGVFLVTILFNVPLNETLVSVISGSAEGSRVWKAYLVGWMPWNHIRTISSIAALACFIIALRKW